MTLKFCMRFSYGVGHVFNDLCASMWFSYLLIFFHQVKLFNNVLVGNLILLGQVADAICTPFVGYESDRTKGICKMGKRKTWHFVGTICVMCSFPFIFNLCPTCEQTSDLLQFLYYAPFVVIFQFGWASVQISHLSLIPDLTPDESERVGLNGIRYAFTVLSNLLVYAIAWLLFDLHFNSGGDGLTLPYHFHSLSGLRFQVSSSNLNMTTQSVQGTTESSHLMPKDAPKFMILSLCVVGVGLIFSTIFHLGVREVPSTDVTISGSVDSENPPVVKCTMNVKDWLKEHQFYQVAMIYMCTRLVVNISQVYLPVYLTETLKASKDSIAIIPLMVFVFGFFTSLFMRQINKLIGRKLTYVIGVIFVIGACIWIYFIEPSSETSVYGVAAFLGIGGSTMLVTSLAIVADLIDVNTESGAFVYGAMSFTDKLSNGVAIELIQYMHPCTGCCPLCNEYYRKVLMFIPGGFAALGLIALLTLLPQTLGQRRKQGPKLLKSVTDNKGKSMLINAPGSESSSSTGYESSYDENEPLIVNTRRRAVTDSSSYHSINQESPPGHGRFFSVNDNDTLHTDTGSFHSINNSPVNSVNTSSYGSPLM